MRLKDKVAIVVGAGQAPGTTAAIGNGRATALLFAREGAKVLAVDRYLDAAEETAEMARAEGGEAAGGTSPEEGTESVAGATPEGEGETETDDDRAAEADADVFAAAEGRTTPEKPG